MELEQFGGLVTLIDPTNLPNFMSPDCSDVEFIPGLVKTRPGTIQQFPSNPTVNWNYLKTYVNPQELPLMLALDSTGQFWQELTAGSGSLSAFGSNTLKPNGFANSVSLFGSEFIAVSDGQFGVSMPRQLDEADINRGFFDRQSRWTRRRTIGHG